MKDKLKIAKKFLYEKMEYTKTELDEMGEDGCMTLYRIILERNPNTYSEQLKDLNGEADEIMEESTDMETKLSKLNKLT